MNVAGKVKTSSPAELDNSPRSFRTARLHRHSPRPGQEQELWRKVGGVDVVPQQARNVSSMQWPKSLGFFKKLPFFSPRFCFISFITDP